MTRISERWRWHGGAFLLYAAVSIVFLDHGVSLTQAILGYGADSLQFTWFLAWWPWAVAHGLDPFYCHLIWQPLGVPLMWVSSVPFLALVAAPVTLLFGPVFSYNLLILTAPVLSAFCAYLLCFRATGLAVAAWVGGFVFGFSGYEMAANLATPNLSFTLFIPAMVLLALVRLDAGIGRFACVALAVAMMVCEFFISIEIFATMILFGFITWAFAFRILPGKRDDLLMLFRDVMIAAPIVVAVLLPVLIMMAAHAHFVAIPAKWPYIFTADLLNFFIPAPETAIGSQMAAGINGKFIGGLQEEDAYLGLPLIIIVLLFIRESWRTRSGAFLLALFTVFVVASCGPFLRIGGAFTPVMLPWLVFLKLPLISSALPGRFAVYVSLVAALMVARWIAQAPGVKTGRLILGLVACIALIPAPHAWAKIPSTVFFQPGRVEAALGPAPKILVLPFGGRGASTYWQMENHFGYAQTGGYLGYPPAAMQHFPAVEQLFDGFEDPSFLSDLQEFCAATKTQYIVAGPGTPPALWGALGRLNWASRKIDDVTVFTVPAAAKGVVRG